eukprot:3719241-Rhodomonas_salina.1
MYGCMPTLEVPAPLPLAPTPSMLVFPLLFFPTFPRKEEPRAEHLAYRGGSHRVPGSRTGALAVCGKLTRVTTAHRRQHIPPPTAIRRQGERQTSPYWWDLSQHGLLAAHVEHVWYRGVGT